MKKILFLFAVMIASAVCFATAPTVTNSNSNIEYKLLYTYTTRSSVTGAATATCFPKWKVTEREKGWNLVAVIRDSVNANADSVYYKAVGYLSDDATTANSVKIGKGDSTSTYGVHYIPIGTQLFGNCFSITMTKFNATTVVAVKRVEIWGFRSLCLTRSAQ